MWRWLLFYTPLFDFDSYGSNNHCGVLANFAIGEAFKSWEFNLPHHEPLNGCEFSLLPYFLLGDDMFFFKKWLFKPFLGKNLTEEEKVGNSRLPRCRRAIENTFAILVAH